MGSEPEEPRELPRAPLLSSTRRSLFSRQRKQAKMKGLKRECKQESFPRQTVFPTPSEERKTPSGGHEQGRAPTPTSSEKQGGAPVGPKAWRGGPSHQRVLRTLVGILHEGQASKRPDKSNTPPPVHLHGITKASAARAGVTQAPVGPCGDTAYHTLITKAEK